MKGVELKGRDTGERWEGKEKGEGRKWGGGVEEGIGRKGVERRKERKGKREE